tara:strand:+ start:17965 stop:18675 length:711 start_codon:yes stop_codon:yes gene_type:complete
MVNKVQSWSVHFFTASGALAGFLSLEAIYRNNIFEAFLWLSVAFFIDGVDGSLARRYKVSELVPSIDGSILDNIIDYLNYVFIPAVMVYVFKLVPDNLSIISVGLILIVSCYTFSNTKLKTEDYYFQGFPALWNIVVFYLFVIETSQFINFLSIVFLSVMTFIPLKYVHPFRVEDKKTLNLLMTILWSICCALLLIDLRETPGPLSFYRDFYYWIWIILSLFYAYASVIRSFREVK